MADNTYTSRRTDPASLAEYEKFSAKDKNLIESFEINSAFDSQKHVSELHIYTLGNSLLRSVSNYVNYSINLGSGGNEEGSGTVYIDPEKDALAYGYNNGGVKLLYIFFDNLFSEAKLGSKLYIKEISNDRTELKLSSTGILKEDLKRYALAVKDRVEDSSFFSEFRLNLGNNELFIGINIDYSDEEEVVTVKLYEPLPISVEIKSTLYIVEFVSDPIAYEIQAEFTPIEPTVPRLREANFNIDLEDNTATPSQYFNYDELFSYSVENSNYQIYSLFNEKGAELSIDHSNYENFIHFSSAEERLINFKYKLDLLNNYSASIQNINTDLGSSGITSDKNHYQNLIEGIVNNFDHYERFLYFESGSYSWPKSNSKKPYVNQQSSTSEAITWFADQRTAANNYDVSNFNALTNTIPAFIREDDNNAQYTLFVQMIAQHFDNLWIYSKAVSDKYNADNRLNVGVSRDLVEEAIKSLGVKLYNSSKSLEDLFKYFVGEFTEDIGENINQNIQAGTQIEGISKITEGLNQGLDLTVNPHTVGTDNKAIYETGQNGNTILYYKYNTSQNAGKYYFDTVHNEPYFFTFTHNGNDYGPHKFVLDRSWSSPSDFPSSGKFKLYTLSLDNQINSHYTWSENSYFWISRYDADGNDLNSLFTSISPPGLTVNPDVTIKVVDSNITTSTTLVVKPFDPLSKDLYQKNIYKRIYHNLPFLLKTKGTQRGLRALINCFGIPSSILSIKTKGGRSTTETPFLGTELQSTVDNSNIRVNDNGTIISGSVLSQFTSMVKPEENYNQDLHNLEVGFSPSDNLNSLILKTLGRTFNVDDYIGDPRDLTADSYNGLLAQVKTALADITEKYDVKDFVRLIKFFDNVVFKMIKDFVPARSTVDTGVIIKPHILDKSKAKSVAVSITQPEYSGSLNIGEYSGSDAGFYESTVTGSTDSFGSIIPSKYKGEYNTDFIRPVTTPLGSRYKRFSSILSPATNTNQAKFNGELQNSNIVLSTGELNVENPVKKIKYPSFKYDLRFMKEPPEDICFIPTDFEQNFLWLVNYNEFIQRQNGQLQAREVFSTPDLNLTFENSDVEVKELYIDDPTQIRKQPLKENGELTQTFNAFNPDHSSQADEGLKNYFPINFTINNSIDGCFGTRDVTFVQCKIGSDEKKVYTVSPEAEVNLADFFTGLDHNTEHNFFIVGRTEALTNTDNFYFKSSDFGEDGTLTLECVDSIVAGFKNDSKTCKARVTVRFDACILKSSEAGQVDNEPATFFSSTRAGGQEFFIVFFDQFKESKLGNDRPTPLKDIPTGIITGNTTSAVVRDGFELIGKNDSQAISITRPKLDDEGNFVLLTEKDEEGNIVLNDQGKPIFILDENGNTIPEFEVLKVDSVKIGKVEENEQVISYLASLTDAAGVAKKSGQLLANFTKTKLLDTVFETRPPAFKSDSDFDQEALSSIQYVAKDTVVPDCIAQGRKITNFTPPKSSSDENGMFITFLYGSTSFLKETGGEYATEYENIVVSPGSNTFCTYKDKHKELKEIKLYVSKKVLGGVMGAPDNDQSKVDPRYAQIRDRIARRWDASKNYRDFDELNQQAPNDVKLVNNAAAKVEYFSPIPSRQAEQYQWSNVVQETDSNGTKRLVEKGIRGNLGDFRFYKLDSDFNHGSDNMSNGMQYPESELVILSDVNESSLGYTDEQNRSAQNAIGNVLNSGKEFRGIQIKGSSDGYNNYEYFKTEKAGIINDGGDECNDNGAA